MLNNGYSENSTSQKNTNYKKSYEIFKKTLLYIKVWIEHAKT